MDPAGIYAKMDFKTRDMYRKEIESLSFATGRDESELAELALSLARSTVIDRPSVIKNNGAAELRTRNKTRISSKEHESSAHSSARIRRFSHIGNFVLGKGRAELEKLIGYKPDFRTTLKRWIFKNASFFYLANILLLSALVFIPLLIRSRLLEFPGPVELPFGNFSADALSNTAVPVIHWILILILVPALMIATLTATTSFFNWLLMQIFKPRILPKLDFEKGIPGPYQTLVVIPSIITSFEDIDSLAQQIELHYLRNTEPGLLFALLTDFKDAESETLPEDEGLVQYMAAAIEKLNLKYGASKTIEKNAKDIKKDEQTSYSSKIFFFLHRKRQWNPSEGKWIGWERKRGKLQELNRIMRGGKNLSFLPTAGNLEETSEAFKHVRFVITLDTDTILPSGAAGRLAGTLAHPLNRPVFDEKTGKVISGYTILQPRVEIQPRSADHSWFTRLFAGDAGLDLYTLAVSDAYQDLFGEGIYIGKGIYDVDAFERCVDNRIPENTVLSHDLLEGLMGRAGLVTDITMIEDYPQNYFTQTIRLRRWVRGDWQLLPYLFRTKRQRIAFSAIDRWKLFDNLRRSMLTPSLFLIFILGVIFMPGVTELWTSVVLLTLSIPLLTGLARSSLQIMGGEVVGIALKPLAWNFLRWLMAIAFLPYEAYFNVDAILTTLFRMLISHKNLLQWTTAARTARLFEIQSRRKFIWQKMNLSTLLAILLVLRIELFSGVARYETLISLADSAPVILLWMISPIIAWWVNLPTIGNIAPLNEDQVSLLRQIIRRSWGFFERFVGPEDNWLPPDHYQESPVGTVAHRTSPTNIGLLLTSTLAAYDFGYLDQLGLVSRLTYTIDTLGKLERFRGHFLNWYDTLSLQPLYPRYVSTVDGGNLAASLIVTAQACKTIPEEPIFRWDLWQGYLDTLSNLTETIKSMCKEDLFQNVEKINHRIDEICIEIIAARNKPEKWYSLYLELSGPFWKDLSTRLLNLVEEGRSTFDLRSLEMLQEVTAQVEQHHNAVHRTINELVSWIPYFENQPRILQEPYFIKETEALKEDLPYNLKLGQAHKHIAAALQHIAILRNLLSEKESSGQEGINFAYVRRNNEKQKAMEWLEELIKALGSAGENSISLINKFANISTRCELYVNEMDFSYLYHKEQRAFHIGYNLDAGQLDANHYDLLASEARIASIVAIAKGEVPQSHWLYLGRPVTLVEDSYVLLSWSGTMFEYLMPQLFLRSYKGTLLAESSRGAVKRQIAYGMEKKVPWGISESGYYRFDDNQNYQYRAFGVPGLGFERGLGDDLVIAPYASLIAVAYDPPAVVRNLKSLIGHDMLGIYGFYESIDFTEDRLIEKEKFRVICETMAHHQGMILMAMANFFHGDTMVNRMHGDSRIQSVELLLQEQVPQAAPLQKPTEDDVKVKKRQTVRLKEITPWNIPIETPIPQMHLLSNGSYNVLISNMGGGYSSWRDTELTRWQPDGVLDPWGTWVYIQEMDTDLKKRNRVWSAAYQPIPGNTANLQVTYFAHMAVFRRLENGIVSNMEVTVSPDDPVEIRRIQLHNMNDQFRILRMTSYGEVILSSRVADARHPAFNKLFIESEFVPELNLQIFKRRPRTNQETAIYLGHMLVIEGSKVVARNETDRSRFIGRDQTINTPAALKNEEYLTGTTGPTLDPIFALGQEVKLKPHESAKAAFLTFAADSREAIIALALRYRSWTIIDRSFHQADIASQTLLSEQDIGTQPFKDTLKILSALIYSFKLVRASPETIAANRLGQPVLWRFGISGDCPILLVKVDDPQQVDLVREALLVHKLLRTRRFLADLVILNGQKTDYGAEVKGMILRLVSRMNSEEWLNQNGGIFILYGDQMKAKNELC